MKTIKKLGLVLCSALVFVACDTVSDDYKPGSWDAAEGFEDVSFVGKTSVTDELDPTDPKTATVTLKRKNTKGELVVAPEVTVNDDSVFTVTDFHFADGDSLATATISFPDAKIGTPYSLQLTVTDKKLVSSYSQAVLFNYSVTRVKWVSLGKGTYIDNVLSTFWNITDVKSEPEFFIRDDDHTLFRVKSPLATATFGFQGMTLPYVGEFLTPEEAKGIGEWFTFRVLQKGQEFDPVKEIQSEDLVAFDEYCTGAAIDAYGVISYHHPYSLVSVDASYGKEEEWKDSKVVSWQTAPIGVDTEFESDEKIPAEINLGALAVLPNIPNNPQDRRSNPLVFYFPGYKPAHKADLKEDFEWEEVYNGVFTSEQLGTESEKTLYKGICTNKTDACDSTFAAKYGTAYTIQSPYAEDYNLIFTVKDGNIMVPEGYELQEIGVKAMGQNVFAKINMGKSKYTKTVVTLNITFTDETGEKEFGTANEVLSNVHYSKVGTADWTYTLFFANKDGSPNVDAGLELQQRDDDPTQYCILHALKDVTIKFSIDADNIVRIPQQYTGHSEDGLSLYVADVATLMGEQYRPSYPSVYDPETKTISASLFYNLGDGRGVNPGVETIKLNFDKTATVKKAAKKHHNTSVLRCVKKRFNVAFPWTCYSVKSKAKASHLKAVKTSAAPQFFLGE